MRLVPDTGKVYEGVSLQEYDKAHHVLFCATHINVRTVA